MTVDRMTGRKIAALIHVAARLRRRPTRSSATATRNAAGTVTAVVPRTYTSVAASDWWTTGLPNASAKLASPTNVVPLRNEPPVKLR